MNKTKHPIFSSKKFQVIPATQTQTIKGGGPGKGKTFTRATKAQSDIQSKYDQSLNGIAQNLKG